MNNVYTLLPAPRPAGEARAASIPEVACKERATKPAGRSPKAAIFRAQMIGSMRQCGSVKYSVPEQLSLVKYGARLLKPKQACQVSVICGHLMRNNVAIFNWTASIMATSNGAESGWTRVSKGPIISRQKIAAKGRGGGRASASLPLLGDAYLRRLRRGALHLPARRSRQRANVTH